MSSIRPWAVWRRVQYALGFFLVWGMVGVLIYFTMFYQTANCFDRVQNGNETGVDCGGGCVRICAVDVLPPRVVWVDSFEITDGQYNVVGYVENQNQTAATPELTYRFELMNDGEIVAERSGTTVLPPNSVYPIFEGRIFTDGGAPVTDAVLTIESAELWLPASIGRDQFRATDINLTSADSRPRLEVAIENTEVTAAKDVEVVATVFNELGKPVTASQTFIEQIDARSTKDIVFTWPESIAKTVRSCVIPTDVAVAIDLSGSMNNDGSDPPQPITDTLAAASQFVSRLQENDQVAVITFATEAKVVSELTTARETVAATIGELGIEPAEETGFTNTVAALQTAERVLNSSKHNEDARRVLVLLTDGLPTAKGDADVVAEAEALAKTVNELNIEVYAIGLGESVDQEFIRNIASFATNAYFAPTGADLARIYEEITSSLCEVGPTKIDVIAKTETNFAPLR